MTPNPQLPSPAAVAAALELAGATFSGSPEECREQVAAVIDRHMKTAEVVEVLRLAEETITSLLRDEGMGVDHLDSRDSIRALLQTLNPEKK